MHCNDGPVYEYPVCDGDGLGGVPLRDKEGVVSITRWVLLGLEPGGGTDSRHRTGVMGQG